MTDERNGAAHGDEAHAQAQQDDLGQLAIESRDEPAGLPHGHDDLVHAASSCP